MIKDVAYNTGGTISGTTQVNDIAIATDNNPDYTEGSWVGGVDSSDGYVIVSDTTSANLVGRTTGGGTGIAQSNTPTFWKSDGLTDQALIDLINKLPGSAGNYSNVTAARNALASSSFAIVNDYTGGGGSPTGYTITIMQSGNNVVVNGSGSLNIDGLIYVGQSQGPGQGGLGAGSATFIIGGTTYFDQYSGSTINTPANFGSGGASASSGTGGPIGVIFDGAPPYLVVVPTGYTSGQSISGSMTFNNTTVL